MKEYRLFGNKNGFGAIIADFVSIWDYLIDSKSKTVVILALVPIVQEVLTVFGFAWTYNTLTYVFGIPYVIFHIWASKHFSLKWGGVLFGVSLLHYIVEKVVAKTTVNNPDFWFWKVDALVCLFLILLLVVNRFSYTWGIKWIDRISEWFDFGSSSQAKQSDEGGIIYPPYNQAN